MYRNSPRPIPLSVSLLLHAAVAWALLWAWNGPSTVVRRTLYDEVIAPHETKLIWYRLRELPKVSSEPGIESPVPPAAATPAKDTIVSHSTPAPPARQLVWKPEDPPLLDHVPAPNMIALQKNSVVLPNFPKPAPALQVDVPKIDPPKAPPRPFVPPDVSAASRKPATEAKMLAAPEPSAAVPSNLQPAGSGGASDVNALVLNLMQAARGAVPPGSRSDISVGPSATGQTGPSRGTGIQIAGVTVRPEPRLPKTPEPPSIPQTVLKPYLTTNTAPLEHTFSAGLPPSSRSIPKSIEARFRGRVVYTMVVPMRKVPGYSGDWIIWFAERLPEDGSAPAAQMRAPLPMRKFNAPASSEESAMPARIQLFATINKIGRVDSVAAAAAGAPANEAAMADLKTWEFLPALRNRDAVDVDVIVEIPYAARSASPLVP